MKNLIIILSVITLGSLAGGSIFDTEYSQKMIGFGVAGLFFLVFPLFSYYRWKDYMLTKENLDKMREKGKEKKF